MCLNWKREYLVDIFFKNELVEGSPFICKVNDPSLIEFTSVHGTEINKTCEVVINTNKSGKGELFCLVNNGAIACSQKQTNPGIYFLTFTPTKPGNYIVGLKFNNENVESNCFFMIYL